MYSLIVLAVLGFTPPAVYVPRTEVRESTTLVPRVEYDEVTTQTPVTVYDRYRYEVRYDLVPDGTVEAPVVQPYRVGVPRLLRPIRQPVFVEKFRYRARYNVSPWRPFR